MQIHINNIGIINDSKIDVNGLSVIAGENSSGKTTIGKVLFAIIKMMNNYQTDYKLRLRMEYDKLFTDIYNRLENNLINKSLVHNYQKFDFFENEYDDLIREYSSIMINEEDHDHEEYEELKSKIEKIIFNNKVSEEDKIIIKDLYRKIRTLRKSSNIEQLLPQILKKYFTEQFSEQIVNYNSENASVKIIENENEIINFKISNGNQFKIINFKKTLAKDVTYIESPYIFSNYENNISGGIFIHNRIRYQGKKDNDLLVKLTTIDNDFDILGLSDGKKKLLEYCDDILKGKVVYNKFKRHFEYSQNGNDIDFINTATGIKSFAILNILLKNGSINENDVLIFDEPEVHLHPVWQVKYAELMVLIVKYLNIKILVNTHSTYFIEALNIFSIKHKIKEKTNFYLVDKGSNGNYINKVNDNLQKIYAHLNKPFDIFDDVLIEEFSDEED